MVLGKKSDLQAPVLEMLWKILVAYAVSIAVCFAASWVATGVVLKPLKKMLEDIKKQRGRVMHFEEGEIIEIKSIYSALNDMTKRLEESYSRYDFTMEEVERNLGSFTYHCDTEMTDVSRAVQEILCIPEEYITREREVSVENWERIKEKLTPFHELNAYTFTDAENNVHCVSFKTKEEEKGVFGVVMDKTVEYKKISQLKFVSEHDYMTKLYNASYMKEQGEKLLEKHRGKVNAMMFCDLDNLKYVNDHYGHSMGDAYIIAMADKMNWLAERITMSCPDVDIIAARISGDEFAMLFTGFGAKEDIQEALIDLHERRSFISITNDEEYSVRVSIGFVYESDEVDTVEALLKCADIAMYSIKSRGKNGVAMYVDESNTKDVIFSGAEEQESV